MKLKKLLLLVGTRPNFIKVTQFKKIAGRQGIECKIVHTGQHFDANMSDVFFQQLGLQPDYFLNVKPAAPASQMGEIMMKLESLMEEEYQPDLLIVPGDVNSTLAGALVANKMNIPLAHLESGLRSGDRDMPEEINRILTDEITDHYFVTEESGRSNLVEEDKKGVIHFVGNTMIDTLVAFQNEIDQSSILEELKVQSGNYVLMTVHRPSNVDHLEGLQKLIHLIEEITKGKAVVLPLHPRTKKKLTEYKLIDTIDKINDLHLVPAMGYFEFQKLVKNASFILTDSGGIQEESTFCQVPCLTIRDNTERPCTTEIGSNTLVPFEIEVIKEYITKIERGDYKKGAVPELWDGKTTERILEIIKTL